MKLKNFIKSFRHWFFSFILIVLSVSSVLSAYEIVKRGRRLAKARDELQQLKAEKAMLEKRLEYVKSEEFVEEEARNKLNMVKPGEEVYLRPKIMGDELIDNQKYENGEGNVLGNYKSREDSAKKGPLSNLVDKIKNFLLR